MKTLTQTMITKLKKPLILHAGPSNDVLQPKVQYPFSLSHVSFLQPLLQVERQS